MVSVSRWIWIGLAVLLLVRLAGVEIGESPIEHDRLPNKDRDSRVYSLYGGADQSTDHIPPGGWKWDMTMIQLSGNVLERPQAGGSCIEITYKPIGPPQEGTAEIFWDLPENVWGDNPAGKLLKSSRLVFKARGKKGREQAEFQVGGFDSAARRSTGVISLTDKWRQHEISLEGLGVHHLLAGFCFRTIIPRNLVKSTIYLDEILLEVAPAEELYYPEDPEDGGKNILSISASYPGAGLEPVFKQTDQLPEHWHR